LGVILIARPVLIDFQYGQVNIFLMGAAVWALLTHFSPRSSRATDIAAWATLAIVGVAKLFPLPYSLFRLRQGGIHPDKLKRERLRRSLARSSCPAPGAHDSRRRFLDLQIACGTPFSRGIAARIS